VRANFVSYTYGICPALDPAANPTPEDACAPPLEIQSWPSCERSVSDYELEPGVAYPNDGVGGTGDGALVYYFDGGTRVEIHTGTTTVVIMGDDPDRVEAAIASVQPEPDSEPPGSPSPPPEDPAVLQPPAEAATTGQLSCSGGLVDGPPEFAPADLVAPPPAPYAQGGEACAAPASGPIGVVFDGSEDTASRLADTGFDPVTGEPEQSLSRRAQEDPPCVSENADLAADTSAPEGPEARDVVSVWEAAPASSEGGSAARPVREVATAKSQRTTGCGWTLDHAAGGQGSAFDGARRALAQALSDTGRVSTVYWGNTRSVQSLDGCSGGSGQSVVTQASDGAVAAVGYEGGTELTNPDPPDGLSVTGPDPGGDPLGPDAPIEAGPSEFTTMSAGKPFGYHEPVVPGGDFWTMWNRLTWAAAGGADHVRIIQGMCPGFSNWGPLDNALTRAKQLGMKVVLVPMWSRIYASTGGNCHPTKFAPPGNDQGDAWRLYVLQAVDHVIKFNGAPSIAWVEVWNEPNLDRFWCGGDPPTGTAGCKPDPEKYASAYRYAWRGVQASGWRQWFGVPVPVMTGGPGQPAGDCGGPGGQFICARDFLERVKTKLVELKSGHMVDMTGAHIYPEARYWDTPSEPASLYRAVAQFNHVHNRFMNKPTFITEGGIRSQPGWFYQCNRLLDIYNWMSSNPDLAGLTVFRLFDGSPNEPGANSRLMGTSFIDAQGNPAGRWAYYVLKLRAEGTPRDVCEHG
jgi:hypothetical protein